MKAARVNLSAIGFLILVVFSSPPVAAQDRPLIGVRFRIEAPDFRRNLYKSIPDIEQKLAESLAKIGTQEFGFLGWQRLRDIEDPRIAAVLNVSLTTGPPKSLGWTIWLRFSAETGDAGSVYQCSDGASLQPTFREVNRGKVLDRPLFSHVDPQPTGNAELLKEEIVSAFDGNFQTALSGAFLSKIPFCREARPHVRDLLKIGVLQGDLRDLDESSEMNLRLCSLIQGRQEPSIVKLKAAIDSGSFSDKDPDAELIQARISDCTFGESKKECLLGIQGRFQEPLAKELFMIEFKKRDFRVKSSKRVGSAARN